MNGMLIGLSGLAGSGKDTAASALVDEYDGVVVAFADPIKRVAADVYGFSEEQLWGPSEMRNAPDCRWERSDGTFLTPRQACQVIGTEMGRTLHPDTWVRYALKIAAKLRDVANFHDYSRVAGLTKCLRIIGSLDVYVSDVRFPNEVAAIKDAGGIVLRVVRLGAGLVGSTAAHVSETGQTEIPDDAFDAIVHNNGSIDDFRRLVVQLVYGFRP